MNKTKIIGINTTTITRYGTYLMEESEMNIGTYLMLVLFEFLFPVHTM